MSELIRDTVFGHLIRFISRGRLLKYAEERDPSLWKRYIDTEKSGYAAHHGTTEPQGEDSDVEERSAEDRSHNTNGEQSRSSSSSGTRVGEEDGVIINQASGVEVDSEKGRDIYVVTWYGPDGPEYPMNWSHSKKSFVTFEIVLLTFGVYIGSAIYTSGIPTVQQAFGVSQVAATLGLTLFVAGYGIGPMLWSLISEIPQIGRNPIYIATLFVFVLFQIPTALAVNLGMLLAFRFLTGFFGSPAYDWTWTIWELMWLSGFILVLLFSFLPETSANNILYRRTRRLRKLTGNDKLRCEPEFMAEQMTGREIVQIALIRPFILSFTEPIVLALNLYIALVYDLLYIWFESFVIVFVEIYGFNLGQLGLAFLGILVGALLTIPPFFWYLYKVQEKQFNERGEIQPEKRLIPACVGAFFIPVCLFWFGWSASPDIHWIMPIIGSAFFSVGTLLLFNSVLNYLPDAYPEYAALVLAGNDFMRPSFGAGFPLFAAAMYRRLGTGWASSLLAFLGIAFIPIPFALYFCGERIRKASKHARQDF
ncbi:GTPase-activating protein [Coniosporium tulheliwenetii]|uniref:GTPase-activating protein n=1 Tax=Coniosporium tulheliwenetii TaxID=3383036 RepID=A0ACC2ZK35_9PEZI|nr:GTPase-activating protein [Cladosporium sp. JES 115]